MGRIATRVSSSLLRRLLRRQQPPSPPQSQPLRPISTSTPPPPSPTPSSFVSPRNSNTTSRSISSLSPISLSSLSIPTAACLFSSFSPPSRSFSSSSDSSDLPSNMVVVSSEDQLNESFQKAADVSSSSVFYFTALWCGPCRFLWPNIKNLSDSLPDVKFYKVDIDEVRDGTTFSKLNISSVPTLYFFKNGKKVAEVVGADPKKIKDLTSSLYKD